MASEKNVLGTYRYQLMWTARPAGLEKTITFKAPLGEWAGGWCTHTQVIGSSRMGISLCVVCLWCVGRETVQTFRLLHFGAKPTSYQVSPLLTAVSCPATHTHMDGWMDICVLGGSVLPL